MSAPLELYLTCADRLGLWYEQLGESSKSAGKAREAKSKVPAATSASSKAAASKSVFGSKSKSRESSVKPEDETKEKEKVGLICPTKASPG